MNAFTSKDLWAQHQQFVADWNNSMGSTDGFGHPTAPGYEMGMGIAHMQSVCRCGTGGTATKKYCADRGVEWGVWG